MVREAEMTEESMVGRIGGTVNISGDRLLKVNANPNGNDLDELIPRRR
jgi:hypothetical protein